MALTVMGCSVSQLYQCPRSSCDLHCTLKKYINTREAESVVHEVSIISTCKSIIISKLKSFIEDRFFFLELEKLV